MNIDRLTFKDFLEAELKSSEEELNEVPVAAEGDLTSKLVNTRMSSRVLGIYWKSVGEITAKGKRLSVYKLNKENTYIVGTLSPGTDSGKDEYIIFCSIELEEENIKGKKYVKVARVETVTKNRGQGIATALYKFLIKEEKINLISDSVQFFGARILWVKLSEEMSVDVLDSDSGNILMKNVTLKHGDLDHEIDTRVWSYVGNLKQDYSKHNIRFILRDIR